MHLLAEHIKASALQLWSVNMVQLSCFLQPINISCSRYVSRLRLASRRRYVSRHSYYYHTSIYPAKGEGKTCLPRLVDEDFSQMSQG